jgi:hypothetical protein
VGHRSLPNVAACENGLAKVIVLLPEHRNRRQDGELRLPKVAGDLALAERFQGLLDTGAARNRADLARRFRLTRARVTQLMALLRLHPMLLAYVKSLPPGTPTRFVTERGLRALVVQPPNRQLVVAKRIVPGFACFIVGAARCPCRTCLGRAR